MSYKKFKKGEKRMVMIAKPTNKAFVVHPKKTNTFLEQKNSSVQKTLERFQAHQPKNGVTTPYKGKNV